MDAERLKEFVADRLNQTAKELYGIDNFTDMIGDETVATDPETLDMIYQVLDPRVRTAEE